MLFTGECGEKKIKSAVALPLFVLDSPQKNGQNKINLTEKKKSYTKLNFNQ